MSEWCQNKDCPNRMNQNQIRGSKGNKYYQSRKTYEYYYNMFCSQGCFRFYFNQHQEIIKNAVGEIGKQTVPIDNAWGKVYLWRGTDEGGTIHYLENKLLGEKITITEEQYESIAHNSDDATRLANQLLSQAKVA